MTDHENLDSKAVISESNRADLRIVSNRVAESYSTVLRKAREKRGLNEKDVAEKLHVSVFCIKALENQRYESLPEDTYVKGYIRAYAALVNLNPEGLIKDFLQDKQFKLLSAQQRLEKERQELEQARLNTTPVFDQKVHLIWHKILDSKNKFRIYVFMVLIFLVAIVFMLQQKFWNEQDSQQPQIIESVKVQGADGSIVVSEFTDHHEPTPMVNVQDQTSGIATQEDRIKMVFSDSSWITIRDANNQLLHQSRETKGEVFEFSGVAPFYLKLSNGKAVTLSLNGKEIDFSHALTDDGQLLGFKLQLD